MNREEFKEQMTVCRACGMLCDGDVCDDSCAALLAEDEDEDFDEDFDDGPSFDDEDEDEEDEDDEEELD